MKIAGRCLRLASLLAAIALLGAGCNAAAAPPAQPPTPGAPPAVTAVEAGKTTFANRCARCHGARGQGAFGPPIIGANATLEKFNTAQGLYNFISVAMPFDAPGSLSRQEYLQVLSFLLSENTFVSNGRSLDPNQMDVFVLQK